MIRIMGPIKLLRATRTREIFIHIVKQPTLR